MLSNIRKFDEMNLKNDLKKFKICNKYKLKF